MAQRSLPFRIVDSLKSGFRAQPAAVETPPPEPEDQDLNVKKRHHHRRSETADEKADARAPQTPACECKGEEAEPDDRVCLIHRPPSPKRIIEKGITSMAEAVAKATEARDTGIRKVTKHIPHKRKGRALEAAAHSSPSSSSAASEDEEASRNHHHVSSRLAKAAAGGAVLLHRSKDNNAVSKTTDENAAAPEPSTGFFHHHKEDPVEQEDKEAQDEIPGNHHLHIHTHNSNAAAAGASGGLCKRAVKSASLGVAIATDAAKREHEKHLTRTETDHHPLHNLLRGRKSAAKSSSSSSSSAEEEENKHHHKLKTGLEVGLLGAAALGVAEAVHHHRRKRKRRSDGEHSSTHHQLAEAAVAAAQDLLPLEHEGSNSRPHRQHRLHHHKHKAAEVAALGAGLAAASAAASHLHRRHSHRDRSGSRRRRDHSGCPLHGERSASHSETESRHRTPCPGIRRALAGIGMDQLLQKPKRSVSTPKYGSRSASRHHTPTAALRSSAVMAALPHMSKHSRGRNGSATPGGNVEDPQQSRPIFTQSEIMRILRGSQSQVSCEDLRSLRDRMRRAAELQAAAESRIQAERSELEAVEEILLRIQREENKLLWHEEETERRLQTLEVLHHHRGRESITLLRDEARRLKNLISEIEKKVADEEVYEKRRSAEEFGALKHSTSKERENVKAALVKLREERQLHLARAKEMRERIFDERRRLDILMDEYRSLEDATQRLRLQLLHFGCPHCSEQKCVASKITRPSSPQRRAEIFYV